MTPKEILDACPHLNVWQTPAGTVDPMARSRPEHIAVPCRACAEAAITTAVLEAAKPWTAEDQPLPEDEAIGAAHPTRTGKHERYAEALRFVGAKRSKYALVDLVNWLLAEKDAAAARERVGVIGAVVEVLRRHGVADAVFDEIGDAIRGRST